jgi:hypothetical protein
VLEICEIGEQGGLVAAFVMLVCLLLLRRDKTLILAVINYSTSFDELPSAKVAFWSLVVVVILYTRVNG